MYQKLPHFANVDTCKTWRSVLDLRCARADTYVKTCLVTRGNKRLQKKSTRTVRASVDPLYQDTIKYSASNVHGRYIQVSLNRSTRTPSNTRPPTSTADTYRLTPSARATIKSKWVKDCENSLIQRILDLFVLQIVLKNKLSGFERNPSFGDVLVKLDTLNLSVYNQGWYKLFKQSTNTIPSTESLSYS